MTQNTPLVNDASTTLYFNMIPGLMMRSVADYAWCALLNLV